MMSFDMDRDGILDSKDCRPWDPTRQHIKPNKLMLKELESLPAESYDYPYKKKRSKKLW